MTLEEPYRRIAAALAAETTGHRPIAVRRFGTGLQHYVFDIDFEDRAPVVVRIASERDRQAMEGAFRLSNLLRPRGVRLPRILSQGIDHQFPHLVLERLPGTDLGDIAGSLSRTSLGAIAREVATAQAITAQTGSAGRYGYAIEAKDAPFELWSEVLLANLARSRKRIVESALFDTSAADAVAALVSTMKAELDGVSSVAFLHDTTTKNVIVTATGAFCGIVDVDDLCFGDPRYAAALTLAALKAFGGPMHYVDAWLGFANFKDDALFRLYVALFVVGFMSEHGKAFNGNPLPSSAEQRARLNHVFGDCLRRISA
jgi:aminoglycoside phosphotransferase